MKTSLLYILMCGLLLVSCYNQSPEYASYEDYPVCPVDDLGVVYTPDGCTFNIWAPTASYVELLLFNQAEGGDPAKIINMRSHSESGVWSIEDGGDMQGMFYTFRVCVDSVWYEQTPGIWANAVTINGERGAIVDPAKSNPPEWEKDRRPPLKDFSEIILYELHHRDMTVAPSSGIHQKGKFLAWTEKGTQSPQGYPTGIDHLKELGVTHVHILPSFDFGSINEKTLFLNRYNWGYDPTHYNVPEGSYTTDPGDPLIRMREFKEMIKSFHDQGIRVVMDVVYNHTYRLKDSPFSNTVPGYFYRTWPDGSYSDASGCGNETASEREMMRRYMVASCKYWVEEFHVDGFRFDLMGIHDRETMNLIRRELTALDSTLFIYGEGWTAGNSPYPIEKRAMKGYARDLPGIAVYNDDLRDALKGEVSNDTKTGYVSGRKGMEESIKFGIVGGIEHPQIDYARVLYTDSSYVLEPTQIINYASSHDNLCLRDKLHISVPGAKEDELIRMHKLAQTIVLTSQGIPFLFCGEEVFRTKQGVHNSYQSPDSINQIDWNFKHYYENLFVYYRDLIAMRKKHPAFHMEKADLIRKNLQFLESGHDGVILYRLNGKAVGDEWQDILVILNRNKKDEWVLIPYAGWRVAVEDGVCYTNEKKHRIHYDRVISVAPQSAKILYIPAPAHTNSR